MTEERKDFFRKLMKSTNDSKERRAIVKMCETLEEVEFIQKTYLSFPIDDLPSYYLALDCLIRKEQLTLNAR